MAIPDESIDDLIGRWERAFGERLTRDDARMIADRVVYLYRRLLQHHRRFVVDEKVDEPNETATPPT